jgi:ribosome-associated protein
MLVISPSISIDEREIQFDFIRASGPGGQNVNKVATSVQLRFDVRNSPSLTWDIKERLMKLAGRRVTEEGILIIEAKRHRTQDQNRQEALDRLTDLIRRAQEKPKPRHPTRPTRASKERRLAAKRNRSDIKKKRQAHPSQEE